MIFTVCNIHMEQIFYIISIGKMSIGLPSNDRKACVKWNSCKKKDSKFNKIDKRTWSEWTRAFSVKGRTTLFLKFIYIFFYHIFAYIHVMVPIYLQKCCP